MNKVFTLALGIIISFSSFAQNNQGFKYQAIIRDAAGNVNANASVAMEISILQSSADGTVVFTETHNVTSNTFGLVNLTIGSQNPSSFELIDWANGPYFIKIVVDGLEFGTSQLLSVPYALHAKTAESVSETDPLFSASTASSITQTQIDDWTSKLSEFAETDPNFNASVAAGITAEQIETWTNKLNDFVESDPEFAASLAKGITASDTTYWNSKLDYFIESDPTFLAHPSAGITADDITMWKALWIWYTTNSKGYLTSEVDGSVTNEIQAISKTGLTVSLNKGGGSFQDSILAEADVDMMIADEGYQLIANDGDTSSTNELQVLSISNDTIFLSNDGFVKLPASSTSLHDAYNNGKTITANSGAFTVAGNDGIISTGTKGSGNNLAVSGTGARFLWYPKKAAFRAGNINDWSYDSPGNQWNNSNIGNYSFAIGLNTTASYDACVATGSCTVASGGCSTAMGLMTTAESLCEVAIGCLNTPLGGAPNEWNSTDALFICGNGDYATRNTSNALVLYKNGNMTIAGSLTENSDKRLKKNITNFSLKLDQLNQIQPVYFEFKNQNTHPEGKHIGFIAQEIKEVFPELVSEDSQGFLSVDYGKMTAVLFQATKELKSKNTELEKRISKLEELIKLMIEK